jgi:galactonate dehydratase
MPKVVGVEFFPFSAQHHNVASRNWLVVKLLTDQPGLYGLGDASAMENDAEVRGIVQSWVERFLVGKDPLDSEVFWTRVYEAVQPRGGRLGTTALSGLDVALWDLKGKILGQPVYRLLGGAQRPRIRVYANGWYTAAGSPETNAREAREVVSMAYTALKFDPFGPNSFYGIAPGEAQLAEERVAAVREAVGANVDVLVEAHRKFAVATAIQLGKRLERYRPMFYEEPVSSEDPAETAEVRARVDIPIATGERLYTKYPFARLLEQRAVDVLQPDIAHAGGITELKKIAAMAEAYHVAMAPHNVCSPVGAIAEMHLDASLPNFLIQEYHAEFYTPHYFTVTRGFPRQRDGYVELSDAPGLGLELDEGEIARHPPSYQR